MRRSSRGRASSRSRWRRTRTSSRTSRTPTRGPPRALACCSSPFPITRPRPPSSSTSWKHVVGFARERELLVVHDFAYADLAFDGHEPPSILQVPGARDVAVELYTLTKSFSMAGWRVGFLVGNEEVCGALAQPQELARLRHLPADPDRRNHGNQRGTGHARRGLRGLSLAEDALCDGLERAGWSFPKPRGTMFAWAPVPEPFAAMGSLAFAEHLAREGKVAVSPGSGFGPGGEGFVRFALVENEHRIRQAVRGIRRVLEAGPPR